MNEMFAFVGLALLLWGICGRVETDLGKDWQLRILCLSIFLFTLIGFVAGRATK